MRNYSAKLELNIPSKVPALLNWAIAHVGTIFGKWLAAYNFCICEDGFWVTGYTFFKSNYLILKLWQKQLLIEIQI